MGNYEDNNLPEYYEPENPYRVECIHCGEVFEKDDLDDEDLCPECGRMARDCEECGERVFLDGPHYTSLHGEVFCGLECWDRHLKELDGGTEWK